MNIKKPLLATGALAVVSLAGLGTAGIASATTDTSTSSGSSIIEKLATKFNLNTDEVKAVFEEDRTAREAERAADRATDIADAVKDGDITQEQADHITAALKEIDTLRGATSPRDEDDTVRDQIRDKMDELRDWMEDNDVDMDLLGHGGHKGGFGGPGGRM